MFNMSVIIRIVILLRSQVCGLSRCFLQFEWNPAVPVWGRPQSTPDRHETSQSTRTHAHGTETYLHKPFSGLRTLPSHFYPTYNNILLQNVAPSSNLSQLP
jgi:hypothetical protein